MPRKSKKSKQRIYYYYHCPECSGRWVTSVSKGKARECRNCKIDVQPYKQSTELELDKNRPCFGHYKCTECSSTWMSANSWVGFGQKCKTCKITVMAHIQTPLRPSYSGDDKKAHLSELCEKCLSLGHNCRRPRIK